MQLTLRNSNFRLKLLALFLSQVDAVDQFGLYSLTNLMYPDTGFWVLLFVAAAVVSLVLFSLIAGVPVDRMDKAKTANHEVDCADNVIRCRCLPVSRGPVRLVAGDGG